MKTIKPFTNDETLLKKQKMSKIFGGNKETSKHTEYYPNKCGTCEKVTTTDVYQDCNGNGKWDRGESGTATQTFEEVECPSS